jgi:hypothetical protein
VAIATYLPGNSRTKNTARNRIKNVICALKNKTKTKPKNTKEFLGMVRGIKILAENKDKGARGPQSLHTPFPCCRYNLKRRGKLFLRD